MATTFKNFTDNDRTATKTLLHEAIPMTGTIASGTYKDAGTETNIKNYSHGMFQSVYDYPYLSSSSNHIFDITCGYSTGSALSGSQVGAGTTQENKKVNIYNQMAQVLMGHDESGKIRRFDQDGDLTGGTKLNECYFLNFSRLLTKDEIKKGSFEIKIMTGSNFPGVTNPFTINDAHAPNDFKVNSPAGEYAILTASSLADAHQQTQACGLIFYQAGIAVLTASVFDMNSGYTTFGINEGGRHKPVDEVLSGSTIQVNCDGVRNRIQNVKFNNTTELNSTIYFCRVNHSDFNYSANPTYLSASKIRVKENSLDSPVSYMTTVGLYSPDNELMAVAKLSEPLKKTPETETTIRVRLDY